MGCGRIKFGPQERDLIAGEGASFSVSEEAIHASRNVTEMKGNGSDVSRSGVKFFIGQGTGPPLEILLGQIERVQYGARNRQHIGVRPAKPRFG